MTVRLAERFPADHVAVPGWLEHPGAIDLQSLLERLSKAGAAHEEVTIGDLVRAVGKRSFAPILLAASILGFTPLGAVPGIPTTLAVIIILVASQILLGCRSLWLPQFLRHRQIKGSSLAEATAFLKPAGRIIDRFTRPRLVCLTEGSFSRLIALVCVLLSLAVPPLEFVPLLDIPLWGVITAFSLALATHDGLLAIVAVLFTPISIYLISSSLL